MQIISTHDSLEYVHVSRVTRMSIWTIGDMKVVGEYHLSKERRSGKVVLNFVTIYGVCSIDSGGY